MTLTEKYHTLIRRDTDVAKTTELLNVLSKGSIDNSYLNYVETENVEIAELLDNVIYIDDSKELIDDLFKNLYLFSTEKI